MYNQPVTPFPTFGYFGPSYFCDREEELENLTLNFRGNQPTLLLGIRRLGKTGLLHHFIHHLNEGQVGIYVDLQDASNLRETVAKLSEAIINAFPQEKKYQTLWNTIKKLRPSISFDEFTGMPQVSLGLTSEQEAEQSLSSLLDSLCSRPERIALILDEFQQVINFKDMHVESVLRSEIQCHPKLHYIFSGSKTHLLSRIFHEANRPFYGMVDSLHLTKLNPEVYASFITGTFQKAGKDLPPALAHQIVEWTSTHTYYTQFVCNQLFLSSQEKVTDKDLKAVQERIIRSQAQDFFQIKDLLSPGQWRVLTAICIEKKLFQPNAREIVDKYKLGNTTAIRKAINVLLDKQLIHVAFTPLGEKYYQSSQPFLAHWINSTFRSK